MDAERANLGLQQVLGVLRRRAAVDRALRRAGRSRSYGFSKHQTKKYTATASLVFNNNQQAQQLAGLPAASSSSQQAQQTTNLKLVQLGDMAEQDRGWRSVRG